PVICFYTTLLPPITYCLFLFIYVNCACTFYVNMLWQRCILCSHANIDFVEIEYVRYRERERERERERDRHVREIQTERETDINKHRHALSSLSMDRDTQTDSSSHA